MKTVTVNASKAYNVHICGGLIDQLGLYAMEVIKPCTACIVSDTNVWPIYGKRAVNSLKQYGFSVVSFVFDAGEEQKNGATFLKLLNFLAEWWSISPITVIFNCAPFASDVILFSIAFLLNLVLTLPFYTMNPKIYVVLWGREKYICFGVDLWAGLWYN